MVETRHVSVKDGDLLLMVGTMKGAFLLRTNRARARWETGGPHFPGHAVYAMAYDGRAGRHRLWSSTGSMHWGAVLRSSDDFGRSWTNPEQANVKFPAETGAALRQIWQIRPGRANEPDTLYCGVEPAALFESRDGGETWALNRGLYDHPHRSRWQPGGGGLCLHTILPDATDPRRITIAISTGGVYRSDDGGKSWQVKNQGVRAEFLPDKYPEFGQCVHKVAQHPSHPERLFLQNHWGLYRSDDGGDSWRDIARGVPSDFGFPMVMHPHDPDTVYILPLESDEFRCTPEGKLRVYRTRNGGESWEALTRGLPQKNALETVLRDAMTADPLNPAGIYFGTRNGQLYGSRDGGASWNVILGGLPPIVCVRAAWIGGAPGGGAAKTARARRPIRKVAKARAKPARHGSRSAKARASTGAGSKGRGRPKTAARPRRPARRRSKAR
ncbi:MAG TPA: exo-alpha-sialidase [Candidatus Limnocylindria bacterium]|nr:exo-alpha-sialidase [Candidatus Limnocylindria bacterium]